MCLSITFLTKRTIPVAQAKASQGHPGFLPSSHALMQSISTSCSCTYNIPWNPVLLPTASNMTQATVTSHLDYFGSLLTGLPASTLIIIIPSSPSSLSKLLKTQFRSNYSFSQNPLEASHLIYAHRPTIIWSPLTSSPTSSPHCSASATVVPVFSSRKHSLTLGFLDFECSFS